MQDGCSASSRIAACTRTTFCCSGVGSKKSRGIAAGCIVRVSYLFIRAGSFGLRVYRADFLQLCSGVNLMATPMPSWVGTRPQQPSSPFVAHFGWSRRSPRRKPRSRCYFPLR